MRGIDISIYHTFIIRRNHQFIYLFSKFCCFLLILLFLLWVFKVTLVFFYFIQCAGYIHFVCLLATYFVFYNNLCIAFESIIFLKLISTAAWKFLETVLLLICNFYLTKNCMQTQISYGYWDSRLFALVSSILESYYTTHAVFILFACMDHDSIYWPSFVFCIYFFFLLHFKN